MVDQFVIVLLVGKLVMYLARKAPYFKGGFLKALFDCELCLGVWVYSSLALLMDVHLPQSLPYVPIFSEFFAGSVLSFAMWLLTEGWNAKFSEQHIYMD